MASSSPSNPMTPANDTPVTVEVEDRWLYLALRPLWLVSEREGIMAGKSDQQPYMQMIARHRLAALASAPAGDGVDRVNPDRSGLERMTMMDDEMGLPDEPMPLSPNAVPEWHNEAFHNAILASSQLVDPVSDEAILDLATETLAREWEKDRNPIYADMIRKGEDVHRSGIAIRAIAAALDRPRAAVGEQDVAFLNDLAARLFKLGSPSQGLDQSDTDQLYRIARILALQSPPAKVEG